ncbi:acyltransferase family protein [Hymenobacter cellulosivorans]|uniref:Acyltransferase n=1 Tax=Hymenobacter cellulosivorans TaxID=2932249 RepID=A0ABY4FEB2_9BACT|nr:acyltransferase [Hymenobacter cellulosivorans]UOQ54934.1 acyltransferase [Hymenobacter cellulosivorans]
MPLYPSAPVDETSTKPTYRPELDVFRAVAILLVLVSHWFPATNSWLDLGGVGVTAFFVLSGFLITSVLRRAAPQATGTGKGRVAFSFFVRRVLRLLPAYYFALLLAWGLKLPYMQGAWQWFVLHGANIFLFRQQQWGEGMGHFWSLAVEEQFYLFWPAVILLLPRCWLGVGLTLLVVTGPLIRWWLLQRTGTTFALILTPACLDLFALGAGLSLVLEKRPLSTRFWLGVALFSVGLYCMLSANKFAAWFAFLGPSCMALAAAAGIALALTTASQPTRWLLRQPLLVTIGRLSYGLYLYHLFMPVILHRGLHHLGGLVAQGRYYQAFLAWETTGWAGAVMALMLLALALFSWQVIEQPFLRLQRFFPYGKAQTQALDKQ